MEERVKHGLIKEKNICYSNHKIGEEAIAVLKKVKAMVQLVQFRCWTII